MNSLSIFQQKPIQQIAQELGLLESETIYYGRDKAKVELSALSRFHSTWGPKRGKLILVSAINPTPLGEGKTTTSIALSMGLNRLKKKAVLALREPSLGPVFGVKGGGTGGKKASLSPADDINLHFTGDMHAITSAHNLLSSMIDNSLHFDLPCDRSTPFDPSLKGGKAPLDPRQIGWPRALDMNDRSLRRVLVGLGGKTQGVPREERFDITAASEIMAILALSESYDELESRLGNIKVGISKKGEVVTARDLGANKAMTALLRDALKPNLVQTVEGGPAFVHAGPFANIAHGCNSVLATRFAMALGDYAITEAGFGFDLGGEKFLDLKCRKLGQFPDALVLVATLRALKMHGGATISDVSKPDREALLRGLSHLEKHLETAHMFGLPTVVSINQFPDDKEDELHLLKDSIGRLSSESGLGNVGNVKVVTCNAFSLGGLGALELAHAVVDTVELSSESSSQNEPKTPKYMYELGDEAEEKIRKIAKSVYGAIDVEFTDKAKKDLKAAKKDGYGLLPICMAKTQSSLSHDPKKMGRPKGFHLLVREVQVSAGAGFLVVLTGDMMTMPGLPKAPASWSIELLPSGRIKGLMQHDEADENTT